MLILTVPLIDTSLQMNLYKVHNLPTVHPKLQIQVQYELEGKYFTILKDNMYVALPDEENVRLCIITKGYLCLLIKLCNLSNKSNSVFMLCSFKIKIESRKIVKFPLKFRQLIWPIA